MEISPESTASTIGEFLGKSVKELAAIASNHSCVFASPSVRIMEATKARNDPFVGAIPKPAYSGSVRSQMLSGRGPFNTDGLMTTVRARPEIPTHVPSGSENRSGTRSVMEEGSTANRLLSVTKPREAGSCARKTSAGDAAPSRSRMLANSALSPYRTSTAMPVSVSNCSTSGPIRSFVRPL